MTRTILDINILQTVPPSNINRDDTGSPKTAVFGGTRRARVSSQAWKRATRLAFNEQLDPSELGIRTKRVVELLAERIRATSSDIAVERAQELAGLVFAAVGIKLSAPRKSSKENPLPEESGYLLFLSTRQLDHLASAAVEADASEDAAAQLKAAGLKKKLDVDHSVDIALFGRMVADSADLNVDASAQVAHAISVHAVNTEFDYFTAVDDHKEADEDEDAGAGMIGTVEFNSSTLYRYAAVDVDRLFDNLGSVEAAKRAVEIFLDAFVRSLPTGKQNTFANRTLPDGVVVSIRDSQPVNMVGAFERAVEVEQEGVGRLTEASEDFVHHAREVDDNFGTTPLDTWVVSGSATQPLAELGKKVGLTQLVAEVGAAVSERLAERV